MERVKLYAWDENIHVGNLSKNYKGIVKSLGINLLLMRTSVLKKTYIKAKISLGDRIQFALKFKMSKKSFQLKTTFNYSESKNIQ